MKSTSQEPKVGISDRQMVSTCTGLRTGEACKPQNSKQHIKTSILLIEKRSCPVMEEKDMLASSQSGQSDTQIIIDSGYQSDVNHVYTTLKTCLDNLQASCHNDAHQLQLVHVLQMLFQDYYQHDQLDKESFPFDLLYEFYLSHDCTSTSKACTSMEDDCWSDEHQLALCIISKWLGKEFNKYGASIAAQVEQFKSKNIDRINDLPPAGQLVHALFPPAMCCLLQNWMGFIDNEESEQHLDHETVTCHSGTSDEGNETNSDHPKSREIHEPRPSKKPRQWVCDQHGDESRERTVKHLYPLIQVILEFANQTLISGVAHVLYTRLIH